MKPYTLTLKIIIPVQFTQISNCTLRARDMGLNLQRTDNKENQIFLICKEIQLQSHI